VRIKYFAAFLCLVCTALLTGQDAASNNGKTLFSKYGCYQCHGTQGQGTTAGARLAPKPIAVAAIIAYVRQPKGQMPPYTAKVVSDAELADIRAYLASIPEPPPAKSIPLLNQ
jgi:mono/diheme cytochrome c family protein